MPDNTGECQIYNKSINHISYEVPGMADTNYTKPFVRTALAALMAAFCIVPLHATIVKTRLAIILKSVTPVPVTARDAHARCDRTDGNLAVIASIQSIRNKLDVLRRAIDEPYPSDDAGAKAPGALEQKCIRLIGEIEALSARIDIAKKALDLETRYKAKHEKIRTDYETAIKSCPTSRQDTGSLASPDTTGKPDKGCARLKKSAAADRHIEAATRRLGELRNILSAYTAQLKPLVIRADALLEQAKYGDLMDIQRRARFMTLQSTVLRQIIAVQETTMRSITDAARWVEEKRNITAPAVVTAAPSAAK